MRIDSNKKSKNYVYNENQQITKIHIFFRNANQREMHTHTHDVLNIFYGCESLWQKRHNQWIGEWRKKKHPRFAHGLHLKAAMRLLCWCGWENALLALWIPLCLFCCCCCFFTSDVHCLKVFQFSIFICKFFYVVVCFSWNCINSPVNPQNLNYIIWSRVN